MTGAGQMRFRFRSRGRFERFSRTASCRRTTRFSTVNSAWLRRSDRRRTKMICIQPMLRSQTHDPKMHVRSYERSGVRRNVNCRWPWRRQKPLFLCPDGVFRIHSLLRCGCRGHSLVHSRSTLVRNEATSLRWHVERAREKGLHNCRRREGPLVDPSSVDRSRRSRRLQTATAYCAV